MDNKILQLTEALATGTWSELRMSWFGSPVRATNGYNSLQFRSENAHVAMLHSAFRASLEQIIAHFRLRTGSPNQLSLHEEALNELEGDTEKLYTAIVQYLEQ
jgi:hypothetical protein